MYHVKTVPVIVGALGMIKKETNKRINKLSVSHSRYKIQIITLYRTAYFLRRVLPM